jgi:hypothetical protein
MASDGWQTNGATLLAAANKGSLRIAALHASPATQLVALFLSRLHPSTQAQAPVTEPECSVPGQPNIAGPPASTRSLGSARLSALVATIYICKAVRHPARSAKRSEPTDSQGQSSVPTIFFAPSRKSCNEPLDWHTAIEAAFPRTYPTAARDGWISTLGQTTLKKAVGRVSNIRGTSITSPRVSLPAGACRCRFLSQSRVALHSPSVGLCRKPRHTFCAPDPPA